MGRPDDNGLNEIDREILNRAQVAAPLSERPFLELGRELGVTEDEVIASMKKMWDMGVIRRLGPILDYKSWGMSGVLVAAKMDPAKEDDARAAVETFPEITHAYMRDHEWNLWFTVIAENEEARDAIIEKVAERAGLAEVRNLPQKKSYKLGVKFEV